MRAAQSSVAVVVVIGAALLGYSLARDPGDASFYWLTLVLAGVWAVGALAVAAHCISVTCGSSAAINAQ